MVMAALLVTDELFEARAMIAESQPVDPSLFEPLPELPVRREAEPAKSPVLPVPTAQTKKPEPAAYQPSLAAPETEPVGQQPNGSLKRALKRPQARQSLDERLAEARDNPLPPERAPPRKTGSG